MLADRNRKSGLILRRPTCQPQRSADLGGRARFDLLVGGPAATHFLVLCNDLIHRPSTARLIMRHLAILSLQHPDQVTTGEPFPRKRRQDPPQLSAGRDLF